MTLALALLSGALYWAAYPPWNLWPLALVCWVPLLVAIERKPRLSFALGWVHGLTGIAAAPWLFETAKSFMGRGWAVSALVTVAFVAYHALRPALMGWLYARAVLGSGWPRALAFPILHAACEYLFPAVFPWRAAAQVASCPPLMQAAAWGGPIAVGAWLALTNAMVTSALLARGRRRRDALVVSAAIPVAVAAAGFAAMARVDRVVDAAPSARIALVQPNGAHVGAGRHRTLASAMDLTASLATGERPDLVVWPETIASQVLDERSLSSWWKSDVLAGSGQAIGVPVIAGALVHHANRGRISTTNSAILFEGGEAKSEYEKRKRLAFGEYLPFGDAFPRLYEWIRGAGHLAPGTSARVFSVAGHRIAPLICYEDMSTDVSDLPVQKDGAELLVTLTDDAWFGRSNAASLHLALAKYRAVEHRRYLVRAGNQAGTAVIDPAGRVLMEAPSQARAVFVAPIRWLNEGTLYDRIGDTPWLIACVLAAALALLRRVQLTFARDRGERGLLLGGEWQ